MVSISSLDKKEFTGVKSGDLGDCARALLQLIPLVPTSSSKN
jgi:hypothetical protein